MKKEIVKIKPEQMLLKYLFARLKNGITDGITEEDFFAFLDCTVKDVNEDKSEYANQVFYESDSYSAIAEKAREMTSRQYNKDIKGLDIRAGIVYPNYNLVERENDRWDSHSLFDYGRGSSVLASTLGKFVKQPVLSNYSCADVSDKNFELAKMIAAYYVNDLIVRHISKKKEDNYWPTQCRDIDEYIFKRDIGSVIDMQTKQDYTLVYYQAIRVITEMLEKRISNDEKLILSNDANNLLAYSNFLKMVLPREVNFLKPYVYYSSQLRNAKMNVSAIANEAYFDSCECVFSDPYGDWSDDFSEKKGKLNDEPVLIMERRIGKITKNTLS